MYYVILSACNGLLKSEPRAYARLQPYILVSIYPVTPAYTVTEPLERPTAKKAMFTPTSEIVKLPSGIEARVYELVNYGT